MRCFCGFSPRFFADFSVFFLKSGRIGARAGCVQWTRDLRAAQPVHVAARGTQELAPAATGGEKP